MAAVPASTPRCFRLDRILTVFALASKAVPATLTAGEVPKPWRAPRGLWVCSHPATFTSWSADELIERALGRPSLSVSSSDLSLSRHDIRVALDMAPADPKVRPPPPRMCRRATQSPMERGKWCLPPAQNGWYCDTLLTMLFSLDKPTLFNMRGGELADTPSSFRRASIYPPAAQQRIQSERRQPRGPPLP